MVRKALMELFPLWLSVLSTEYVKVDRASGFKITMGPGRDTRKMKFYPLASRAIVERNPKLIPLKIGNWLESKKKC